jgi:hypothetical protein
MFRKGRLVLVVSLEIPKYWVSTYSFLTLLIYLNRRFMPDTKGFDQTRPSFFRGYGKETLLRPHPALHEEWSTTFRKTYLKPDTRTKPNAFTRYPVGEREHDNDLEKSKRLSTIASGF